jgi:outer membrane protein
MRPFALRLVLLSILLGPLAAAAAEELPPPMGPRAEGGPMLHGELGLSLANAIKMGLENNLDVEIERHQPLIADRDESIAWGVYDPEWSTEFGVEDERLPNAFGLNQVSLSRNRMVGGGGGLQGLLPLLGTSYTARLDSRRLYTNSTVQSVTPENRSTVSFGLAQPLMRDLIWNEPWTRVKTTRILADSAGEDFRRAVMDTVRNIEDAYWLLIAADDRRDVSRKSLETARALLDQTAIQHEVGVVSKVEVTEAEAGVAAREFELIRDENAYRNAQDVLIDLVLGPNLRAESTLEISPTDRPEDYVAYDIDVEEAVQRAFQHRPELEIARKEIERQEVQLQFAKNQRLPQFDVRATYSYQGLSGDGNDNLSPIFGTPTELGDYADSYDDFFARDGANSYSVRGILSIPIPNTSARNTVSRTELELRRARTRQRRLEQNIILEVRRSARGLESAQDGIEAAERRRIAAQEQLRAERIRLEYGESTPFDVLQREEDLAEAENEKVGAFQVYRTSRTGLDRAQGTILRNRNIVIDQVAPLR